VTPIENIQSLLQYDKEKYKEMTLDAAETVLGFFGFDRTVYGMSRGKGNCSGMKKYGAEGKRHRD
jgi:hypothetical protein